MKTKKKLRIHFQILFGVVYFILVAIPNALGGDLKSMVYEGVYDDGTVQDRCLETEIRVSIRKVDHQLYDVKVKGKWSGRVVANSYGEARNIACNKKSKIILYGLEGNEPFK